MRFAIEAWATEYGTPMELNERTMSQAKIDLDAEVPVDKWAPVDPGPAPEARSILFTDGVRRIDARVWIETDDGTRPGVCATYAAGAILCDGSARVVERSVERGLFTAAKDAADIVCGHGRYGVRRAKGDAAEDLWLAIQQRMGELEAAIADQHDADLTIVDGPLKGNLGGVNRVGYIKTHHVSYLPSELEKVVAALAPGQRTPLFLSHGPWSRCSWYVRLPGATGHPWAGIVRCETTADTAIAEAIRVADTTTAALPFYASVTHKDPRAPQNLYPIAGLERELRRLLGDPQLLYRSLRVASAIAS